MSLTPSIPSTLTWDPISGTTESADVADQSSPPRLTLNRHEVSSTIFVTFPTLPIFISAFIGVFLTFLVILLTKGLVNANEAKVNSFTKEDFELLEKVVEAINDKMKVPCTGCRYCMPCPKNVDIPGTFSAYNKYYTDNKFTGLKEYFMCTALRKDSTSASNCIECGRCEKHCPQKIEIRKELKNARKKLENPIYKIGKSLAKLFIKY